ncbi:hypothetical protein OIDMADRAFT_59993 [Oidiodendron maius Zn]|uniref:RTA1 like protein n=1 Tax=Oidiodendron maius (strain Zn) TaxID=913774 RepID=A0A0C3CYS6_OIDMZ|nr:hypothetical protein OIDMADRAFT_59993 [Oidiodendron maius Zn]
MSAICSDPQQTLWGFCPSTAAAILFAILFGLVTFAHLGQAMHYKKAYSWVIIGSGLVQTINYIFRIVSIKNPNSLGPYAAWFVLILIAPLFTNAYVYMVVSVSNERWIFFPSAISLFSPKTVSRFSRKATYQALSNSTVMQMGRMTWNFIPDAKLYRVTAWKLGTYFVVLDIIALIIQVSGASMAAGNNVSDQQVLNGIHIYMGGVGIQQFFILVFAFFAIKFHRTVANQLCQGNTEVSKALPLLYALYAVLLLITMRIIFRLCEYSRGLQSNIPSHEAYQYCIDSLPMLIALVILNVVHPGRIMPNKESDIPSRKERRLHGIQNKSEREINGHSLRVV